MGKLNIFQNEYEDKIAQAKDKASLLKESLDEKKRIVEETITEKKVLLNM